MGSGAYVSVLAGGGVEFKIRPTHRSIDGTLIQPKFIGWLSLAIKSKIFCRSTVKSHLFKQFIFLDQLHSFREPPTIMPLGGLTYLKLSENGTLSTPI